MHTLQLLLDRDRNASTVAGNPTGAATKGGIIGALITSSSQVARALNLLASVIIILVSKGAKSATMAAVNHGGAMCSPEKR